MHSEIQNLLYEAEEDFLQDKQIERFRSHITSLAKRLQTYETIRDQEIEIFQPVADQLLIRLSNEDPQLLDQGLKHWLSLMRYCAMAMLLNNPDFLERRILEWLTDIVQAYQMEKIERTIYQLLQANLTELLSDEQFALIQPFLEQAYNALSAPQPVQMT